MFPKKATAQHIPRRVMAALAKLDKEEEASNQRFAKLGTRVELDERITSCNLSLSIEGTRVSRNGTILATSSPMFSLSEPNVNESDEPILYQLAKEDEACYCCQHLEN